MDDWTMNNMQKHSFGKMNSYKCELNFMILQTNLVIIYTTFIGIVNQVDYIDNQFNMNFQPISLQLHDLAPIFTTS